MTFQLSRRDVDAAYAYANRNMKRLRDPETKGSSGVLHRLLQSGEILAGAAAVGVASGRFGPLNIGNTPVPIDLVGGIGGHLIAFWLDGAASPHIHNVSNGVLAGYITKLGVGVGTSLRMKAGLSPVSTSGDADGGSAGPGATYDIIGAAPYHAPAALSQPQTAARAAAPLTEAELAALAQQVR